MLAVLSEFEELYQVLLLFKSERGDCEVVESEKFMQGIGNTIYQGKRSSHSWQFHRIRIDEGG